MKRYLIVKVTGDRPQSNVLIVTEICKDMEAAVESISKETMPDLFGILTVDILGVNDEKP